MEQSDRLSSSPDKRAIYLPVSSEDSDLFCDPCLEDGNYLDAEGYCVDCANYLCDTCFQHHRRPKPSRHHQLLDKQNMPQAESDKVYKDVCTDKCSAHKDEIIKYFCEEHKEFGCLVCVTLGHRTCKVGYIPTLSEQLFQSQEYKNFKDTIGSLSSKAKSVQDSATHNIDSVKSHTESAITAVRHIQTEIAKLFEELGENVLGNLSRMQQEAQSTFETISKESKVLAEKITKVQAMIEDKETKSQKCRLFSDIKEQQKVLDIYERRIKVLEQKNAVREIDFIPSTRILNFIHDKTNKLGYWVSFHQRLPVQTSDEKGICWITGIAVLQNDRIAVTDTNKKLIKVIDIKRKKVINSLLMSGHTRGIACVSNNGIAVPMDGDINIYSVTDKVHLKKVIQNAGLEYTLIYFNNMFVGRTSSSPHTIRMVNMRGEVVNAFPIEINGQELFQNPEYIAINPDHTALYVSDCGKATVTCLTFEGEVKAQYKPSTLTWNPRGIAVSQDGTVYVCDRCHHCIHILTSDLKVMGLINGDKYGIRNPHGLMLCKRQQKLYVGMGSGEFMIVINI